MFCAVTETTDRVLGERRLQILNTAAAALMETRAVEDAVGATVQACSGGHPDLPFVAVYVGGDLNEESCAGRRACRRVTASVAGGPARIEVGHIHIHVCH